MRVNFRKREAHLRYIGEVVVSLSEYDKEKHSSLKYS